MLDLRTFDPHVLRPSQAILFGPRSALMTRLSGKSATLPQVLAQNTHERMHQHTIHVTKSYKAERSAYTLVKLL